MARGNDRADRHSKRVLDEIEKGIARGDADRTLEALAGIAAPDRPAWTARAAPVIFAAIRAAHRGAQWGRLASLAHRALSMPWLLASPTPAEPEPEALWWPLCWGCAHARDWGRAEACWALIAAQTEREAPRLAAAIRSYLETRGEPSDVALDALEWPTPDASDPRMGYDVATKGASVAAPETEADVAGALMALVEHGSFSRVANEAQRWSRARPELAGVIARTSARVAVRELLRRASHDPPRPAGDVAGVVGQCVARDAAGDLVADVVRVFRVATWWVTGRRAGAESIVTLWRTAAEYLIQRPAHRAWVSETFLAIDDGCFTPQQWVAIARALDERAPSVAFLLRALAAHDRYELVGREREDGELERTTRGLREHYERVLARGPGQLAEALADSPDELVMHALKLVGGQESLEPFIRLTDLMWDKASPAIRTEISAFVFDCLDEAGTYAMEVEAGFASVLDGGKSTAALEAGLRIGPLGRLWSALGERVAPYHSDLLALALRRSPGPGSAAFDALVRATVGDGARLDRYVRVIAAIDPLGPRAAPVALALAHELVTRHGESTAGLARVLLSLAPSLRRREVLVCISEALLRGGAQKLYTELPGALHPAIRLATTLTYVLPKKPAARGPSRAKKPAVKKPKPPSTARTPQTGADTESKKPRAKKSTAEGQRAPTADAAPKPKRPAPKRASTKKPDDGGSR